MSQIKTLFTLIPKTDLHVGAGSEVAGIIDNLVQRNSTTGYPCINSSSLKGAIKQHCSDNGMSIADQIALFGSDTSVNSSNPNNDVQQGNTAFGQAELLALAVPCDKTMFLLVTCPEVLELYLENISLYGISSNDLTSAIKKLASPGKILRQEFQGSFLSINYIIGNSLISNLTVEEKLSLKKVFGAYYERLAVLDNQTFIELASDYYLPIVAHNAIDDGKSENLWYTQNVPMQSVFYFYCVSIDSREDTILISSIQNNGMVHIGANYSTSQGFCKLSKSI